MFIQLSDIYDRAPPVDHIDRPVQPIDNSGQIFEAIQSLKNSLDFRVESACKRQRLADPPSFKREGNKQQLKHSEKILSLVDSQGSRSTQFQCSPKTLNSFVAFTFIPHEVQIETK